MLAILVPLSRHQHCDQNKRSLVIDAHFLLHGTVDVVLLQITLKEISEYFPWH